MTLEEATALAIEIESEPGYLVIAIGRFQIIAELLDTLGTFPWCITAIAQCNTAGEPPVKICNRNDWQNYRIVTRDRARSSPPLKAATKRRDEAHTRQPTLF